MLTVWSNRVDLPREISNLKSRQVKQLKRGASLYVPTEGYIDLNDMA